MLKRGFIGLAALVALAFGSVAAWGQFGTAQPIKLLGLVISSCGGQSYSANSYAQVTMDTTGAWCLAAASSSTTIAITDDTTTNATVYPTWVTAATGNLPLKVSSTKLGFNPSTGLLTSTGLQASTVSNSGTSYVFQSAGTTGTLAWAPATSGKTITLPNGTTDFTATGGSNQVLQQAGSGAAITVGTLATTNLSDVSAASTTWTPSDQSGASLSFASVSTKYTKIGNMVCIYGTWTYPATADGSIAIVGGLPNAVPNQNYAGDLTLPIYTSSATAGLVYVNARLIKNSSNFYLMSNLAGGARLTNVQVTGLSMVINGCYPAS